MYHATNMNRNPYTILLTVVYIAQLLTLSLY